MNAAPSNLPIRVSNGGIGVQAPGEALLYSGNTC
jgi:hypothetical protein